ncbi:MAG: hypothetical protein IPP40_06270 [bacterium]|nr:hypothetical protein [bacterium]
MSSKVTFDGKLEQRLRRSEILNDAQLALARKRQEESAINLAEALVELELLSSGEVEHIVSSLNEIRAVKLEDLQIDLDAVKHVPRHVAISCKCIPIRRSGNALVVAVSDCDTDKVREELRAVTDFEIVLLMAEPDALEHALFIYYGKDADQSGGNSGFTGNSHITSNSWAIQPAWKSTFEDIVEHEGIVRAKEVAKQIASGAWESFIAPVMFIGPTEAGKTHLLTAIKNYCSVKEPMMQGILCTGEQLRASMADYIVAGHSDALKYELRESSIVLIDNVAAAWGTELVESELASLISYLRSNGSTVVVSITDEEYVQGPTYAPLREIFEQGSEVHLALPDRDAMRRICSSRFNARNRKASIGLPEWVSDCGNSWSAVQKNALYMGAKKCGNSQAGSE